MLSRDSVLLAAVLTVAVLARIIFFVGFVHDYGEENVHLLDALRVADGEYLAPFDYLRDGRFFERKTDMVELYKFRLLVHVPSGLLMRVFGISNASLALWFVACSVGVVWLTYRLGTIMYERGAGLLAAAIVAVFPFDVIWSSRVNSDVILSFFFYLSLLLVIRTVPPVGWRRAGQLLLAGVVAGMAYLAKVVALALTPLLIAFIWRRRGWAAAGLILTGFALVFAAETVFYYGLTGVPFLHLRTAAAGVAKNVAEVFPFRSYATFPGLVLHTYTEAFFFLKLLIGRLGQPLADSYFFIWGGAALCGLFVSLWQRRWAAPAIFVFLLAYFELGFSTLRWEQGTLHWYQIFKEPKYFLIAVPVVSLLSAHLLRTVLPRSRLSIVIVIALLALSIRSAATIHRAVSPALGDVKNAAKYLAGTDSPVYVDPFGMDLYLRLFSGDRIPDVRLMANQTRFPNNAIVLSGGTRGLHSDPAELTRYYREQVPMLVDEPLERTMLPKLSLVKEFPSSRGPLRIYRVTSLPSPPPPGPILQMSLSKHLGDHVELNGFVGARGDGNDVLMRVYVNGQRRRGHATFPITVPLARLGSTVIRVVATDFYGSTTEAEVRAMRGVSEKPPTR